MKTNTACTSYQYDHVTGGYDRFVIPKVMWQESKSANVLKSGLQTADSTVIYIPAEFSDLAPKTAAKDMLVKGIIDFEFKNISPQSISESMKEFREAYKFVTVTSIDNKLYGSPSLQHIKVSAK